MNFRFVSITLVFLNKSLLSGSTSVDAPLFITCFQCVVTAAACYGIVSLPPNLGENVSCTQITISLQTLKKVLPLSIVFVAMITFNNLCLKHVGISFYYIGRSLTTVFNVAFTYLILGQKTSMRAIICCSVIIFGFYLGVDQEKDSGKSFLFIFSSCSLLIHNKVMILSCHVWISWTHTSYSACYFVAAVRCVRSADQNMAA